MNEFFYLNKKLFPLKDIQIYMFLLNPQASKFVFITDNWTLEVRLLIVCPTLSKIE